jgi:hypothetical protein
MAGDRVISIEAGTPQWRAWLQHYRVTKNKNELVMLECQRKARGFFVVTEFPPDAPRPDRVTKAPAPAPITFGEHRTPADGQVEAVAERLEAFEQRREDETAEQKKRRKLLGQHDAALERALDAARSNQRPQLEAAEDYDAIAVVDPHEAEELVLIGKGAPMRIKRVRPKMRLRVVALRDDPIGQLAKRHMLGRDEDRDDRLLAARIWQAYYERAEIGGARGVDPSRDIVDGGQFAMPESDQRLRAQEKLHELRQALGFIDELRILGSRLLTWVLGDKKTLTEIAEILGMEFALSPEKQKQLSLAAHLRNCLDILAGELGLTTDGRRNGPRRRRDRYDLEAPAVRDLDHHAELVRGRAMPSPAVIAGLVDKPKLRLDEGA